MVNYEEMIKKLLGNGNRDLKRTCVSKERLENLLKQTKHYVDNNIDGAFVECGTWKGGCVSLMATVASQENKGRQVYAYDSFQGFPEETQNDSGRPEELQKDFKCHRPAGYLSINEEEFHKTFEMVGLTKESVNLSVGLFENTIINNDIDKIAILRLDSDLYESTKLCLETFYDKVIPGGCIIIDDYGHYLGCKIAIDEFLTTRCVDISELKKTDYTERYFFKAVS